MAFDKEPIRYLSYLLTERSEYFNVWQQKSSPCTPILLVPGCAEFEFKPMSYCETKEYVAVSARLESEVVFCSSLDSFNPLPVVFRPRLNFLRRDNRRQFIEDL